MLMFWAFQLPSHACIQFLHANDCVLLLIGALTTKMIQKELKMRQLLGSFSLGFSHKHELQSLSTSHNCAKFCSFPAMLNCWVVDFHT